MKSQARQLYCLKLLVFQFSPVPFKKLQRVRNLAANDHVAVVVDDYDEDWVRLAWVQLRGRATVIDAGLDYEVGIQLLQVKYPQYASVPLLGHPLIHISIETVRSWRMGSSCGAGQAGLLVTSWFLRLAAITRPRSWPCLCLWYEVLR